MSKNEDLIAKRIFSAFIVAFLLAGIFALGMASKGGETNSLGSGGLDMRKSEIGIELKDDDDDEWDDD